MTTKKAAKKPAAKKTANDFAEKMAEQLSPTHKEVEVTTPDEVINDAPEPVITITEAPPSSEIDVSSPASLVPAIRKAWNSVRGDDASFETCAPAWRDILMAHALGVVKTSRVLPGDSHLARFEQALAKIKSGGN